MKKAIVTMMVIAATVALTMTAFAAARGEGRGRAPERVHRRDASGEGVQARTGAEEGEARHQRIRDKSCVENCDGECDPKGGLTDEQRDAIREKKQQLRQEGATQEEIVEAIKAMLDEYGVAPPQGAMQRMRAGEGRQFQGRHEGKQARQDGEGLGEQQRMRDCHGEDDGEKRRMRKHDSENPHLKRECAGRVAGEGRRARDGEGR